MPIHSMQSIIRATPKTLHVVCVFTVISFRQDQLPENGSVTNRPTGEVERLAGLQVANRIEIQVTAEGGQLEERSCLP